MTESPQPPGPIRPAEPVHQPVPAAPEPGPPAPGPPAPGAPEPGPPHAGRKPRISFPTPRRWAVLAAALGAGVGAGLLGTALHGHAWFPNGVESAVPYGAALALVLLAAVSMFVGLWSKSSWIVVWCGAAAYVTGGLLSLQLGSAGMIFDNIQGRVWLYGIAFVTPLVAWLTWAILRAQRR